MVQTVFPDLLCEYILFDVFVSICLSVMPPRTRTTKTSKGLKENIGVTEKTKAKTVNKVTKPARKALADKTNSASDDNTYIEAPIKTIKKPSVVVKASKVNVDSCGKSRPRRDRRLPNRFIENSVLNNLSNSKENAGITPVSNPNSTPTPVKNYSSSESPFKTPIKDALIIDNRPRRICRLPSRFEDHSISPNKFIPVQPVNASTPIAQKDVQSSKVISKDKPVAKTTPTHLTVIKKAPINVKSTDKINADTKNNAKRGRVLRDSKNDVKTSLIKTKADTNNNANHGRALRNKKNDVKICPIKTNAETNSNDNFGRVLRDNKNDVKTSPIKEPSPKFKKANPVKKPLNKSLSFRILDDKKSSKSNDNCDVYEFTYDPNEEPPPQKKKRKRVVKKKPAKPKTVVFSNNYDKNVSKALNALKNIVSKKQTQPEPPKICDTLTNIQQNQINPPKIADVIVKSTNDIDKTTNNFNSVHVEDIAADFEPSIPQYEINYSPVNSPCRPKTPILPPENDNVETPVNVNDPLNLQEHLSFFDDNPVASSSMNISVRHPLASPWRVEFENLPIRWHVNSYVKPNMTPAVECSFVNFDDNKKKHVYTNMLPESNNSLREIEENATPNLKQTSILSFIREVVEKSESKKRRALTPKKSSLESVTTTETLAKKPDNLNKTPFKVTPETAIEYHASSPDNNNMENISDAHDDTSNKENSRESLKRKNTSDPNVVPAKTPRKDKDSMFFGFDDSENQDQENVSPKKMDMRKRGLRERGRAALKEINELTGPTRAIVPVSVKTILNSEANKLYEEMKSASDAPTVLKKNPMTVATNVNETTVLEDALDDDSQSVHLFEDIELVHHLKVRNIQYYSSQN